MSPEDEAALATFFAAPLYNERVRPLLEALAPGVTDKIEAVVAKVRREVWRDFSRE